VKEELGRRQFFITPSHACSYLPERRANTLFLDPRDTVTPALYQRLTEEGFRRSGSHLYRPHCRGCQACIPTRVPVRGFVPKRRQRRTARRNADLEVRVESAEFSERAFVLYARYVAKRHGDGDMFPPTREQFRSFLLSPWSETRFLSFYLGGELVCVAVTDEQPDGLSAIYTFFEPALEDRSLGVMAILEQIRLARDLGLEFLYLGYWIRDCDKMRYKTEYRPIQVFVNGSWLTLN